MSAIARFFQFEQRQTNLTREVRGGVTTYLTMLYIVIVNPLILAGAGIPVSASATATALAAGVCCISMGLVSNFPIALASGMGLNVLIMLQAQAMHSWQAAMGLVVLDGLVILLLVFVGIREAILHAIPRDLRLAIGAGIGLFIAVIGLNKAGIIVGDAATLTKAASLDSAPVLIAIGGLVLTAILMAWRVKGALLIGILASSGVALAMGLTHFPDRFPKPDFSSLFHADVRAVLAWKYVPVLLSIIMVDFFDTLGTATAVAEQGDLIDKEGRIPRLRSLLAIDSLSASVGGLFGCSSVTSYIESSAGVAEGARTGLHSVVVGLLFLATVLIAPLAGIVPGYATAPALILVGYMMMTHIGEIDWQKIERAIPAFVTILAIPLTYSIAHGIGYGFVLYVVLHVARGRWKDVHVLMYFVTALFVVFFATAR